MNHKNLFVISLVVLALLLPLGALALTLRQQADVNVPGQMTYQGYLTNAQGTPVAGSADLEFGIYDQENGGALKWTETHTNVTVTEGYFSVNLGNTTPLTSGVFEDPDRWFQVSVDGAPLSRQPIAAAPYALQAAAVPWSGITGKPDGLDDGDDDTIYTNAQAVAAVEAAGTLDITVTHAIEADNAGGANYSHVVVVAKSGGDYTTIQAAIEAITDETAINPYLVWIAPGTYNEVVTMKPYVHLQGAGQEATIVTSNESGAASPGATIELASYASLRDLTVVNEGTGTANSSAAIRVSSGVNTFVSDVTVRAQGTTTKTYGIYSSVSATDVSMTLQDVTIIVDNDHGSNYGLANYGGEVTVEGGSVTVSGGNSTGPTGGSFSIFNSNTLAKLVTKNVIMSCENAWSCFTLSNENGAIATLYGGSITAVNGVHTRGIRNWGNAKTALVAENVSVHATGGTEDNYGFVNRGARVSWYGGSIIVDGVSPNSRGINASDITGEMTVWQSVVKAADHAIYVYEGNVTLFHSHLEGGGTGGSGTPVCVAVSRDTAFTGAGPTCP